MRRSKVVCTLMDGWFDALERGRNSDDDPWSFVTDGSIDADALRKRRPRRLNRLFGPFTGTFLDRVADAGQRLFSQSCHFARKRCVASVSSINLNGAAAQSLAR